MRLASCLCITLSTFEQTDGLSRNKFMTLENTPTSKTLISYDGYMTSIFILGFNGDK